MERSGGGARVADSLSVYQNGLSMLAKSES